MCTKIMKIVVLISIKGERSNHSYTTMPLKFYGELVIEEPFFKFDFYANS